MSENTFDLPTTQQSATTGLIGRRSDTPLKRRNFLSGVAATGAVLGAGAFTGCTNSNTPVQLPATQLSVVDVLNFALNLEYLEASFYLYVATGNGLSAADTGAGGTVTGGAQVTFTSPMVAAAAQQLATDEQLHVEFLRSTILAVGGTPVPIPNINLAAAGAVNSDATFLAVARQLEGVGTSAYIGGAQILAQSTAALTYAAQILHLEAQHEGFLRQLCSAFNVASPPADAQDLPPSPAQIFNVGPTNGLTPVRTPSQVLQIVYASPGSVGISAGGFFPNGLNGAVLTS